MAKLTEVFTSPAIAAVYNEVASNRLAYLGEGLFPAKQKSGLNLRWIKGSKGLPVILQPSAFDSNAPIRSRQGLEIIDTEMAYFKEAMIVKEQDKQDFESVVESAPLAREILDRIYDDATTLVDGAKVVEELMRMSLLANATGDPSISIAVTGGATYTYDFDPSDSYQTNNFTALSGTSYWTDLDDSDPLKDVSDACDKVEANTGVRPTKMILSKGTMNLLKQNVKLQKAILAQNATANIFMTDARVKEIFATELGVEPLVYTKLYKDYSGTAKKFYPDGMVTLIPDGTLGSTWKGVTPEEFESSKLDVSIVDNGTAITVNTSFDPVQTVTKVSEVVLPSFERMDETYMIKVASSVSYSV